jgi:hypothetical protein
MIRRSVRIGSVMAERPRLAVAESPEKANCLGLPKTPLQSDDADIRLASPGPPQGGAKPHYRPASRYEPGAPASEHY